ncbi:MAG: hypothetical protein V4547_16795 [Bacteroidota bacterium]
MKKDNNLPTEHPTPTTEGENEVLQLEIMGRQVNGNYQRGLWHKNKSGDKVAAVYGDTEKEAEQFANRIVNCVNNFDAVVEALKMVMWDMENGEAEAQKQGKPRYSERKEIISNLLSTINQNK